MRCCSVCVHFSGFSQDGASQTLVRAYFEVALRTPSFGRRIFGVQSTCGCHPVGTLVFARFPDRWFFYRTTRQSGGEPPCNKQCR